MRHTWMLSRPCIFQAAEPGRGYIISKIPEPHLFESFWKLVVDKNCATVVVIDDVQDEWVRHMKTPGAPFTNMVQH